MTQLSRVELHHGAATDVGLVRQVNEDAFHADAPVFAVADGMGGHERGDIASTFAIQELGRLAPGEYDVRGGTDAVDSALREVQDRLLAYDQEQRAATGADDSFAAGTTVVVALLVHADDGPRWLLANVGDSRVYRYTDRELEQVSVDHSLVQELVEAGRITAEDAAVHPSRNVVTRALGGGGLPSGISAAADYYLLPLAAAERLLLCSDGVSGMVDDPAIADVLGRYDDPRDAADALVAAALAAGGRDNATAVVVDVVGLAHVDPYDSDAQRLSLEQKLGALP